MKRAGCSAVVAVAAMASAASAQSPQRTNAALRYWQAFAQMQNPPVDQALAEKLDRTASGELPWDDGALAPMLDANREAIETMQRATRLPACDWGLEVELGPATPISHVARARALARLSVLQGRRLAAKGDAAGAVEAWLGGLVFARHLAADATLLSALVASSSLSLNLRALGQQLDQRSLDEPTRGRIEEAARTLPAYGLDWSRPFITERDGLSIAFERLIASPRPLDELRHLLPDLETGPALASELGLAAGDLQDLEKVRTALRQARQDLRAVLDELAAAYRLPYLETVGRLDAIDRALAARHPLARRLVPSPARVNAMRGALEADRAGLLTLVALRRQPATSLAGMNLPPDPFTGRPFELVKSARGWEVRSAGKDPRGKPLVYPLKP